MTSRGRPAPPWTCTPSRTEKEPSAPSEDKAAIQPGPGDTPAVREQLGQFMNSAESRGKSALSSRPQASIVRFLVFLQMFRCVQSTENSQMETISRGQPARGSKPVAGSLWDLCLLPPQLSRSLPQRQPWWEWGQGYLNNRGLGLSRQARCEGTAGSHLVGSHVTFRPSKLWVGESPKCLSLTKAADV